jgi:hypothetical protein
LSYTCLLPILVDAIEIPSSLLPEIQNLPSVVTVQAHAQIPICTKLLVEPVSVEDWELLEVHSQELELGGLLQQVSVVFTNQRLSLQLKRDSVQVVVKEIFTTEESSSIWPTTTHKELEAPPCVLLVQDTEVIVEPKPRPPSEQWSTPPLRLIPCREDWSDGMRNLARRANITSLVVPPGCVLVNPTCWKSDNEWAMIVLESRQDQMRLVRVMTSRLVPEHDAGRSTKSYLAFDCFP